MASGQATGTNGSRAGEAPRLRDIVRELLALFLLPGTGLRRWLLLGAVGGLTFALGVGYLVRFFSSVAIPNFLPGAGESILFLVVSVVAMGVASAKLTSLVSSARVASLPDESLRASMVRMRERARAPRFTAIGGGTGLSTMLRGLKEGSVITGVVTVADDGGSSGRLREELGMLPPGDIRNCIVALADAEPLMKDLFQYRFPDGSPLEGHSFGNLFIAAMTGVTGSFEEAVSESNRVLNVHGQIVPATLDNVALVAEMADGTSVRGESNISGRGGQIERLYLEPETPELYTGAKDAIAEAQMILIGPGSLYTSIIPNLLVPGIAAAISQADAPVVYICNVASQPGETDGYTVADHVMAIRKHCPDLKLDFVVANNNMADLEVSHQTTHIVLGDVSEIGVEVVEADLMNDEFRIHHDSQKLANAIMDLYHETVESHGRLRGNGSSAGRPVQYSQSLPGALSK